MSDIRFWSLKGLTSYSQVRDLQLQLLELRALDLIPDTFLSLEHLPVITQGRGLQWTGVARPRHTPVPALLPPGMEFQESERGGDLTYHGPGQWVVYPICKLDGKGFGPDRDIAAFLRKLERVWVEELQAMGLPAQTQAGATGIWLAEKTHKIASIGIAVRKWVTFHGLALNCVNDLSPFQLFSPCGFNPEVMTRLSDWLPSGSLPGGLPGSIKATWRRQLEERFFKRILLNSGGSQRVVRELSLRELSLEDAISESSASAAAQPTQQM